MVWKWTDSFTFWFSHLIALGKALSSLNLIFIICKIRGEWVPCNIIVKIRGNDKYMQVAWLTTGSLDPHLSLFTSASFLL